jgi:hypothetical protein
MEQQTGYIDFRRVREAAVSIAERAVQSGLGVRDKTTALDEIKAANVANQATTQAILNAVVHARDYGHSWADIGRALGVTKQGAQKRYADAEEDETALIRAIIESRSAGQIVRVPKPIAMLLPAFQWIRDGLDRMEYADGSLRIDGGDAYVQVPRNHYLEHHPRCIPDRFFLQHLTNTPPNGSSWTIYSDTEHEVKAKANEVWGADRVGDRQEIIDSETGARWIRANGQPVWISAPAPIQNSVRHVAARGYSLNSRRCTCGGALVVYFKDDLGRYWAKCQNDPASAERWQTALRLLVDQSEESYLWLASQNTLQGPEVTAQLINTGMMMTPEQIESRRAELHAAEREAVAHYNNVAVADVPLQNADPVVHYAPLLQELQAKSEEATAERKAFDTEYPVQRRTDSN